MLQSVFRSTQHVNLTVFTLDKAKADKQGSIVKTLFFLTHSGSYIEAFLKQGFKDIPRPL